MAEHCRRLEEAAESDEGALEADLRSLRDEWDGVRAECLALMLRAEAVVVCDAPYGPGNLPNLRLALDAADRGKPVVLLDQVPMAERDFTGGEAATLWEQLRARADVRAGYDEVLAAVGSLAGG